MNFSANAVKCCCQPCYINNGYCDKQHRCPVCRRYLHILCGHPYKDDNGTIVEDLSFPRHCNDCNEAFQRVEEIEKRNTPPAPKPPQSNTKRNKRVARKKLPLVHTNSTSTPPAPTNRRSKRKTNLQNGDTPDAETERSAKKTKQSNNKKNGKPLTPFDEMTLSFENLALKEKAQEINDADGKDSDEEGGEFELVQESFIRSLIEREEEEHDVIQIDDMANDNIAFVASKKGVLDPFDHEDYEKKLESLYEMPEGYEVPEKKDPNEPEFHEIDNPGNWNQFIFRPIYEKKGTGRNATYNYLHHELPTGCTPVPIDPNTREREIGGWKFYYNGWHSDQFTLNRSGATPANLFPAERASSLDIDLLVRLGLTKDRMVDGVTGLPDALFFFQLILPICDPCKSGIEGNDPRLGYYPDVVKYSNYYKYRNGIGSIYGHRVREAEVWEYVRFDGCLVRDGVRGGGEGSIYRRWSPSFCASSDPFIKDSLTFSRWYELKRMFKLNDNSADVPKQGQPGYNPCAKYDLIYQVITHNTCALTKKAELDLCGDESSWPHQGFGEKGARNLWRIPNKPGVSKGGQVLLVSAVNRIRPYFYQHRHKFTKKYGKPLFDAEGPAEVRTAIDELEKMVEGNTDEGKKKIFTQPPHITFDNYFSGEEVFDYAGKKGFGLTMTTRRDRLPKAIPPKHLHKKKTVSDKRSKAARYVNPVVAVKNEEDYEVVLTSFQSTSSTNIMTVNALSNSANFVEARARGRKDSKRIYFIEQNFARQLYLKTYHRVDSIDHFLQSSSIGYKSWKYWHSPANHGKKLAVVTAYDIYLELCEGNLNRKFYISEPADFHTFLEALSLQLLSYDPKNQKYPGDSSMRRVTQMTLAQRKKESGGKKASGENGHVSFEQLKAADKKGRFTTMTSFVEHACNCAPMNHKARCAVCGMEAWKKCSVCEVPLHNSDTKGAAKGKQCFLHYHDENYFGLCFADRSLIGQTSSTWKEPNNAKLKRNTKLIREYRNRMR